MPIKIHKMANLIMELLTVPPPHNPLFMNNFQTLHPVKKIKINKRKKRKNLNKIH